MSLELYEHQEIAIEQLKSGSILCGGVGSGKSRTALAYYYLKECRGTMDILVRDYETGKVLKHYGKYSPMQVKKDLYIITTARKRDTLEWNSETTPFLIRDFTVDSWNNISKYTNVCGAFFIFDEQRVVGSGAWVKAFYQIAKKNNWILLSATPGDTWIDYIPVFVANGFYKNRTEFIRRHVVYDRFAKYPKVNRYLEVERLIKLRKSILINMNYVKKTVRHDEWIHVKYNTKKYDKIMTERWNVFTDSPCKNISETCQAARRVINTDCSRIESVKNLISQHPKVIVFYNYDYELEILRSVADDMDIYCAEWNGHKHQPVPESQNWIYLVQYAAGSEAWNCTSTNAIIFYSLNYSYKVMEQSSGRIDRANTPYTDLYYYKIISDAPLDMAIRRCINKKRNFNESSFLK